MPARIAPSGNFKNPLGLLFRMLTSGKRAAYSALAHQALRLVATPLNGLLRRSEQKSLIATDSSDLPQLLIVGAPRSGTTLVYQTLARYLDVSYFSNLTSLFPTAPITGTRLFRSMAGPSSADFRNFYGQTARLSGPNDGFVIWNQWLGEDRYVARTDLSSGEMDDMKRFFDCWSHTFGKPLINKNNRNTSCLEQLSRALPNAKFVVIRRNPLLVAQSLITARQQVQGDKTIGWGLHASDQCSDVDPLAYVDDVCDQVLQIEDELDKQLQQIPADRIVEITYEGFCEQPHATLREIAAAFPGISLRESLMQTELKSFQVSAKSVLSDAEYQRVFSRLAGSHSTAPMKSHPTAMAR